MPLGTTDLLFNPDKDSPNPQNIGEKAQRIQTPQLNNQQYGGTPQHHGEGGTLYVYAPPFIPENGSSDL